MDHLVLILITFIAATVNGGLGYGFSSITVPVALLFYASRILNPALVLVEVAINWYVLFINRKSVPRIWKRVAPLAVGLLLGISGGSYTLALVQPGWVKFITYFVLLPLILLQAAGVRKPIQSEKAVAVPFGMGIGLLYSLTTISGPPLALLFNNQGYAKQDFRAALSLIRVAESSLTAVAYSFIGLYSADSLAIISFIMPSVLVGIPLGAFLIRWLDPEVFRRLCMSFDAVVVSFGLSRVLVELRLVTTNIAYGLLAAAVAIIAYLLYRFFQQGAAQQKSL